MSPFTKKFKNITLADLPDVGGKNSSLSEMYNNLSALQLLHQLDKAKFSNLKETGSKAREINDATTVPASTPGNMNDYSQYAI